MYTKCQLHEDGRYLATGGEDGRIVLWDITKNQSIHSFKTAGGKVSVLRFLSSLPGTPPEHLLVASESGKVYNHTISYTKRSLHAVTGPELPPAQLLRGQSRINALLPIPGFESDRAGCFRIAGAKSDGHVGVWDCDLLLNDAQMLGHWEEASQQQKEEEKLGAAAPPVLCCVMSRDGLLSATGTAHRTVDLWSTGAWRRSRNDVELEQREEALLLQQLDTGRIRIDPESEQFSDDFSVPYALERHIGQLSFPVPLRANRMHQLHHDASVLCCLFSRSNHLLITGSSDATCRVWSVARGQLVFQINLPGPVTHLALSLGEREQQDEQQQREDPFTERFYAVSDHRVLEFEVQINDKRQHLFYASPSDDQTAARRMVDPRGASPDTTSSAFDPFDPFDPTEPMEPTELDPLAEDQENEAEMNTAQKEPITLEQFRSLIAHGLLLPSTLSTLAEQFGISTSRLEQNMALAGAKPEQLLRALAHSRYRPQDLIRAMATEDPHQATQLLGAIRSGDPVAGFLLGAGVKPLTQAEMQSLEADYLGMYLLRGDIGTAHHASRASPSANLSFNEQQGKQGHQGQQQGQQQGRHQHQGHQGQNRAFSNARHAHSHHLPAVNDHGVFLDPAYDAFLSDHSASFFSSSDHPFDPFKGWSEDGSVLFRDEIPENYHFPALRGFNEVDFSAFPSPNSTFKNPFALPDRTVVAVRMGQNVYPHSWRPRERAPALPSTAARRVLLPAAGGDGGDRRGDWGGDLFFQPMVIPRREHQGAHATGPLAGPLAGALAGASTGASTGATTGYRFFPPGLGYSQSQHQSQLQNTGFSSRFNEPVVQPQWSYKRNELQTHRLHRPLNLAQSPLLSALLGRYNGAGSFHGHRGEAIKNKAAITIRGLNIRWHQSPGLSSSGGSGTGQQNSSALARALGKIKQGHLYIEPIAIRREPALLNMQMVMGKAMRMTESTGLFQQ